MASPAPKTRIGSYAFEAPFALGDSRLSRLNASTVSNPVNGQTAIAFRVSLTQFNAVEVGQIRERLGRRSTIQAPGIVAALEAGIAGTVAFTIEAVSSSTRLSDALASGRRFTPFETIDAIRGLGAALDGAHLVHGQISSALIWIREASPFTIGGFSFVEPESKADIAGLAELAFELLSGVRFDPSRFETSASIREERIREALPAVTAQFASVIATGTRSAFSTVAELVDALDSGAAGSAADLAAAAHQAIGAKDLQAAELFLELGRRYEPSNSELTTVALRLGQPATPEADRPPTGESISEPIEGKTYDPASEQARFLASLKASIPEVKAVKRKLPWFAIAAGMLGMFAIVSVLAFVIVGRP